MRRMQLFIVVLSLLFTACSSPVKSPNSNARPSWIMQPNKNGCIGAVGIAGRTYDQSIATQRRLAITRALDELSLEQGVKVSLKMRKIERTNNLNTSISTQDESSYKTDKTITAHIADMWYDTKSQDLYIYLLLDK